MFQLASFTNRGATVALPLLALLTAAAALGVGACSAVEDDDLGLGATSGSSSTSSASGAPGGQGGSGVDPFGGLAAIVENADSAPNCG